MLVSVCPGSHHKTRSLLHNKAPTPGRALISQSPACVSARQTALTACKPHGDGQEHSAGTLQLIIYRSLRSRACKPCTDYSTVHATAVPQCSVSLPGVLSCVYWPTKLKPELINLRTFILYISPASKFAPITTDSRVVPTYIVGRTLVLFTVAFLRFPSRLAQG